MKILYLTNQVYLHGGIEKILSKKCNLWVEQYNYEVIVCTSEQHNKEFVYPLNKQVDTIDLDINYYRNLSYFNPLNLLKVVVHFFRLKKLVNQLKPDIVISVNYTPEQYFIPFIAKHIPKIKEFHSSGSALKPPKGVFEKAKHRLFQLFQRYQAVVVLNEDEKQYYPFDNLVVIPNFIAVNKPRPEFQKEKTIIAAGRIAAVKQFDHLIQAWALIALEFPDWQVKIYGDGDDKLMQELIALINDLQLTNIKLMGATTTLEEEMQKASIYAMTSATECFPMVLLEAMDAGMVCVSYNCPTGPGNILQHKLDGILTQPDQIEQFAAALKALIIDDAGRSKLAVAANENCRRFSSIKVISQWNALFTKLHKEKY